MAASFKLFAVVLFAGFFGQSASFAQVSPVIELADTSINSSKQIALVYKGKGACGGYVKGTGCAESGAAIAESLGFEVIYVGHDVSAQEAAELFKTASLWVQPGGEAKVQQIVMSDALKSAIVKFVRAGGAYVGFCAGGFMATERFGWMDYDGPFDVAGLGLLKGKSWYFTGYDPELSATRQEKVVKTVWSGQERSVFWALGPYFTGETLNGAAVDAYYPYPGSTRPQLTKAMTLRAQVGSGRVAITGVHPESMEGWRTATGLVDPDGVDFDLAREMMAWAVRY